MANREWRCAVVGTGVVGEWHVRVVPGVPGAKLVAVCDLLPDKCQKALEKNKLTGVNIYKDQAQMLQKEQLDVVHVCTPSGNHMGPATMAMDAGCNVICEKPMEIQLDRIDRMVAHAKARGVRLAGIFQNRWNEANRVLRDAVASGRFGRLAWAGSFTPWYRTDQYYEDGGWRGTWALDGGGAIMNQSVHAIDLLQWIVGPVKQVSAYASSRIHPRIEVEDTLSASLAFENGAFGTILGTTAMYPGGGVRIWVGGEHGTAISENGLHTFRFREETSGAEQMARDKELIEKLNTKRATTTGGGASATDVATDLHHRNISAILRAWEEGKDADTCGPEARKAVAIILAMYESARNNGAPVAVK
jgi:predicted dehydrogenase